MSEEVPDHCRPRLSHVVKWRDFQGYGFNLHAEKGKSGQYIGKIDENSPAEAAGLKEGDRIVEVNGVNIGNENHQQVVTRIKSGGEETRLLVVDSESDNWYKSNKRIVRGDLPEVRFITSKRDEDGLSGHERINGDDEQAENSHPEPEVQTEASIIAAPVHNGNAINEDNIHRPRLCHLKFWSNFEGYGFNLHAEKEKPGQYIGLVDDNSPASTGGLRVNDRIIEVNGVNIEKEKHTEVIARIKAIHGETKLLVVDKETDSYYQKKGITVTSSMPQTDRVFTPDTADLPAPTPKRHHEYEEVDANFGALPVADSIDRDEEQTKGLEREEERQDEYVEPGYDYVVNTALVEEAKEKSEDALHGLKSESLPSSDHQQHTGASHNHNDSSPTITAKGTDNLELNLSVAEMKERLKSKKKQDPRTSKVPFEEKLNKFQRM